MFQPISNAFHIPPDSADGIAATGAAEAPERGNEKEKNDTVEWNFHCVLVCWLIDAGKRYFSKASSALMASTTASRVWPVRC